ncbi:MAG: ABC transporter permease [Anaerolineales bacterium]|nr:ABC transporter permease [Anaerolineales bacterium]
MRRKVRTLLTVLGIAIGVSAMVALGAMADGLGVGYNSMLTGSKADLILSQPNTIDISYSVVGEEIGEQLLAAPEVAEVAGMLQGFVQAEGEPLFFVFGHPEDSFTLGRFQIVEGVGLDSREAGQARGQPILLGSAASEILDKSVGDSLHVGGSLYRIVGIYETGDAFEDSGALLPLAEAQVLLGKPRQVSLFYIRLKDPVLKDRFLERVKRRWPDLSLSGIQEFADSQAMEDMLMGYVWAIGGLAIVIGGVGMMNAQLMAVMERTREIGVLRAVGWSRGRVLRMILMESLSVGLIGGLLGIGIGWLMLDSLSHSTLMLGVNPSNISPDLLIQTFIIVIILGLVGGFYPAWRASRLQPVEALRYEGGSGGSKVRRFPVGGMAVQSLWQRTSRTLLTLGAIGLTVGAIMALDSVVLGATGSMEDMFLEFNAEVMIRQADVADTSLSTIDERVSDKIAAMPEVQSATGMVLTAVMMPEAGFFILLGYDPHGFAIQRLTIVEGEPLKSNHQIIIGRFMANSLNKGIGDTIDLSGVRFRIVGIYETGVGWEEMGGAVTLRDGQAFMGKPRKSTMLAVKLKDTTQAKAIVERINHDFPEVHATLSGDFLEQMPDMQNSDAMLSGISFLAILVGGVGVLNTMLMAVFERTREIGVLRALGWRRRRVLGMILREALLLGLLGGVTGIGIAFALVCLIQLTPMVGDMLSPVWNLEIFMRAIAVALLLGLLGGLYPAYRATRLQPVEALRYE